MFKPHWVKIPESLIMDSEVSHAAVRLYAAFYRESRDLYVSARPSAIADSLGMKMRSYRRAKAELVAKGYLSVSDTGRIRLLGLDAARQPKKKEKPAGEEGQSGGKVYY